MFEVGKIYEARNEFRQNYYLLVLQVARSERALRGVLFDDCYGLVSRRWFKVSFGSQRIGSICVSGLCFYSKDSLFSACYPPQEVLDYYRNDKLALC